MCSFKSELLLLTLRTQTSRVVWSACSRRRTMRQKTRVGAHIKVPEATERGHRCIRRRLIIICTKYFVIVNYGTTTDLRRQDQSWEEREGLDEERERERKREREREIYERLHRPFTSPARARAHFDRESSACSGPLQSSKPLSSALVFHNDDDGCRRISLIHHNLGILS